MAMDIKPDIKPGLGLDIPGNLKSTSLKSAPAHKKGKGFKVFITLLVLVVVIVVAGFLVDRYTNIDFFGGILSNINLEEYNQDSYYAIFLSNGQVYFGKITNSNDRTTVVQDIYYLQVSNPLQQVPPVGPTQQPQLTLIKLGNELHGPYDYMKINNAHIVFIEELKDDSRVIKAIIQYKADN